MAIDKSPETEALREQARAMGLEIHPNLGAAKVKAKMAAFADAAMGGSPETAAVESVPEETVVQKTTAPPEDYSSWPYHKRRPNETQEQQNQRAKDYLLRLRRVIVHCNHDDKQELQGDIFTAGNAVIGTVKRFVPFDNDNGWHIEQIIYDFLQSKRVQKWRNVKLPNGMTEKQSILVPEYTITDLPALTLEELDELAEQQRSRGSVDYQRT